MDLNSLSIFSALKEKMRWHNQNQRVISENLSNADTPGFKAKKLEEQAFSGLVEKFDTTDSNGAQGASGAGGNGAQGRLAQVLVDKDSVISPDGNAVELESEMMNLADNQMKYGMMVNLYRKNMGLLRTALGKRQ